MIKFFLRFMTCFFLLSHLNLLMANGSQMNGEILVQLKDGVEKEKLISDYLKHSDQFEFVRSWDVEFKTILVFKWKSSSLLEFNQELPSVLEYFKQNEDVDLVEPQYVYKIQGDFIKMISSKEIKTLRDKVSEGLNDPLFPKLWGLENTGDNEPQQLLGVSGADIQVKKAWEMTTGHKDLVIAVIDTGIDYRHEDLQGQIWINQKELQGKPGIDDDGNGYVDDVYGYDFANNDSDPMDGHGHGTHCAGTIGAIHNNSKGVAGVMGKVTLVPVKFLSDNGSGTTEGAIKAIDYATQLGVHIMSNSWGGGGASELLKQAIVRAKKKGIFFVAAAGNSAQNNDERPNYPSNYDVENVVAVAATTIDNTISNFSSYGKNTVHVAAPGKNIVSSVNGNRYAVYSGTSMATPHVSGAIGLLLSHIPASERGESNLVGLRKRLVETAYPVRSLRRKVLSRGRLDAYQLLMNERPTPDVPDERLWRRVDLAEVFESSHPYDHNQSLSRTVRLPGAKYMRAIVEKYDLESGYDFLKIRSPVDVEEREDISGIGEKYTSDFISGDEMRFEFTSDYSINGWGFKIQSIEYIPAD